jgi:haloacetate dehalogenase
MSKIGGSDWCRPPAFSPDSSRSRASVLIHSACEDYRASSGIDLEHDRASRAAGQKVACDLLLLSGERGVVNRLFDPLALWRAQCSGRVAGQLMPTGHFIPEEQPEATALALRAFFA